MLFHKGNGMQTQTLTITLLNNEVHRAHGEDLGLWQVLIITLKRNNALQ
jgi:hypothetical protein